MAHLSTSTKKGRSTPREWLRVGSEIGDIVNAYARRSDLVTLTGPDAAKDAGAPACFKPDIAEIEINTDMCFGEGLSPQFVGNLNKRRTQFEYPVPMGAMLHEAMHARFTGYDLKEISKQVTDGREQQLIMALEETRIEGRGATLFPHDRPFLRASAMHLVLNDSTSTTTDEDGESSEKFDERSPLGLLHLMLLTMARVDVKVLKNEDVVPVTEAADKVFGKPLIKKLRAVWQRAQRHDDNTDWHPLHECARELLKLLEDEGHDTSAGAGDEAMQALMDAVADALGEQAEETEGAAHGEALGEMHKEIREEAAAARKEINKEQKEHKETAQKVFGAGTGPDHTASRSRLDHKEKPDGRVRAAATTVARWLDRAKYRDRVLEQTTTVLPPGRLRGRAALQAAADRARGVSTTAEPWHQRKRIQTEDPNLIVGVMVDISGSMSSAMKPMAVTAWMLSEACRRIQATSAMIYYGNDVFPVLKPGQHLTEINVYSANDGTEQFTKAFKALDGQINLLNGTGARLLVIVSDMIYTPHEEEYALKIIARCKAQGIGVLIVPPCEEDAYYGDGRHAKQYESWASVLRTPRDASDVALAIGRAAKQQLEAVGGRM